MSKLLINENPLLVLPSLATAIGLNEAIIVQQVHFWLSVKGQKRDGHRWVYNTYADWHTQFPFWSQVTVRRAINSAEKQGILISTDAYNKMPNDKTKWYRIDYDVLDKLISTDQVEQPSTDQNDQSKPDQIEQTNNQRLPDNTKDSVPPNGETPGPPGTHSQFKNALLLALHGKKWPEDKATIPASLWPPLDDQAKWWRGEKTKADRQPPPGVTPERIIAFYAWWKATRPKTDLPTSHEAIVKWWPVWEMEAAKQANGRREYKTVLR